MIVLGIADNHDSGAAVVIDQRLAAAVKAVGVQGAWRKQDFSSSADHDLMSTSDP